MTKYLLLIRHIHCCLAPKILIQVKDTEHIRTETLIILCENGVKDTTMTGTSEINDERATNYSLE